MDSKLKEIADNYYAVTSVNDLDNSRDCEVLKHKYFMLGCELIYKEMSASQNSSTSDAALPIADVGDQLAISALKKIENPIKYLRDEAEKDGCVLDGRMAIELIKDASFYQEIARKALEEIDN